MNQKTLMAAIPLVLFLFPLVSGMAIGFVSFPYPETESVLDGEEYVPDLVVPENPAPPIITDDEVIPIYSESDYLEVIDNDKIVKTCSGFDCLEVKNIYETFFVRIKTYFQQFQSFLIN